MTVAIRSKPSPHSNPERKHSGPFLLGQRCATLCIAKMMMSNEKILGLFFADWVLRT